MESKLDAHFEYSNLRRVILDSQNLKESQTEKIEYDKVLWLADSYYEIVFSLDTDIFDRVIFPISENVDAKGIEDARFVGIQGVKTVAAFITQPILPMTKGVNSAKAAANKRFLSF